MGVPPGAGRGGGKQVVVMHVDARKQAVTTIPKEILTPPPPKMGYPSPGGWGVKIVKIFGGSFCIPKR